MVTIKRRASGHVMDETIDCSSLSYSSMPGVMRRQVDPRIPTKNNEATR